MRTLAQILAITTIISSLSLMPTLNSASAQQFSGAKISFGGSSEMFAIKPNPVTSGKKFSIEMPFQIKTLYTIMTADSVVTAKDSTMMGGVTFFTAGQPGRYLVKIVYHNGNDIAEQIDWKEFAVTPAKQKKK